MARQSQILSLLLALQIVLAAILVLTDTDSGAVVANEKLLDLQFDSLNKIVIEESADKKLVMQKQGKNWMLPDYFDFPASQDKLDRVLGKLFDTSVGWPVATTEAAEKRFKVAADEFERKLAFSGAAASEVLYLGTSPGFKKIHARVDGQENIYGIEFSAYQASIKPIDWAEQKILEVPRVEIEQIDIDGLTIKRDGDQFKIDGLAEGEQPVESEIQNLLSKVSSLGFQEVLGKKDDPTFQLNEPVFKFSLLKKGGERIDLRYGKIKDQDDFVLKSSASDYYFKVAKYNLDSLQGIDRSKLVKVAEAAPTPESGESSEPGDPQKAPESEIKAQDG